MSIRNILPGGQPDKDPYFKNVSLLLSGDSSTNGGQNNTFLDSSSNNFAITRNGNVTQGSFSPFGDRWSNYFNGSGTSITFSASSNMEFTNDLTIEMYVYLSSYQGSSYNECCLLSLRSNLTVGSQFDFGRIGGAAPIGAIDWWNNGTSIVGSAYDIPLNQWTHIAYVRLGMSSNNCKIYVNGVMRAQGTYTGTVGISTGICYIGNSMYDQPINGNISNLRIVKGTALYTSTFTPPTSPLTAISGTVLLTCQSNRFIDNSTYANTITVNGTPSVQKFSPFSPVSEYNASVDGGSAYFDGNGDWLGLPPSSLDLGSGDFTFEFWMYSLKQGSASSGYNIVNNEWSGSGELWTLAVASTYNGRYGLSFVYGIYGSSTIWLYNPSQFLSVNKWQHVAVCRQGTSIKIFVDGVSQTLSTGGEGGTFDFSHNFSNSTAPRRIGSDSYGGSLFYGYLSNIRILKGTALYTSSSFTPPTTPLTNISNTSFLCNFTNGNIIDSSLNNDLETVGNAQISTSVKKYGTGSMYFDGSGDLIYISNTTNTDLGNSDFTLECYAYPISLASAAFGECGVITKRVSDTGGTGTWMLSVVTSTTAFRFADIQTSTVIVSPTISLSTWHHIAIVRYNGTIYGYLNGVLFGSMVNTTNFTSLNPTYIGMQGTAGGIYPSGTGGGWFNGYIDDLRITKGIARYTTNFTPPTAPLPKQ